jgi:hypothetical protein
MSDHLSPLASQQATARQRRQASVELAFVPRLAADLRRENPRLVNLGGGNKAPRGALRIVGVCNSIHSSRPLDLPERQDSKICGLHDIPATEASEVFHPPCLGQM